MTGLRFRALILLITLTILFAVPVQAAVEPPTVVAHAAVVLDVETGKILFAKNERERMFPASVTKLLTLLVALDYLKPDEFVVSGQEVNSIPYDSSKAYHKVGETLLVENLYRGLIIPSGNETACIVAIEVARRQTGRADIPYAEAERVFAGLMNEKAKSIGATGTNFVNPHGYHNPQHYSTAYDLALISMEVMKDPLVARIAAETEFSGNGAGPNPPEGALTQEYNWKTHNMLIAADNPQYAYSYGTGIKTGLTAEAGKCLAASATKDGRSLISVVLFSEDPDRWVDSINLLEYGFNAFAIRTVAESGVELDTVAVDKPRIGEPETINILSTGNYSDLLSEGEVSRITQRLEYDEAVLAKKLQATQITTQITLKTPIKEGDPVGKIIYSLDGQDIFEAPIVAGLTALERNFNSDVDYYMGKVTGFLFSVQAIPYYVIFVLLLILFIQWRVNHKRREHSRSGFNAGKRRRYR